jgi:uncharacterized damage-inducible protein DinB
MENPLNSLTHEGAETYVRFLVAAETAVLRGQFNVAKVLRALATAQRAQAMLVARSDAEKHSPDDLLKQFITRIHALDSGTFPPEIRIVLERCVAIAQDTWNSLQDQPDVPEWVVAQRLYTCINCGNIVQGNKPDHCDLCGVLSTEFQFFGPFYGSSPEHLGQLMPKAIIAILARTPDWVEILLADTDEELLEAKPSAQEWSIKELIGHLVETDAMFLELMEALRKSTSIHQSLPPWKLHEGKGYELRDKKTLLANLRATRAQVLDYVSSLTEQEWVKSGPMLGETRSLIDTGTWLANHDRGHVAQIERQLGRTHK